MTEEIKYCFFSHDFPPLGYNFIERGEQLSGGKVFIKVENLAGKKFKSFETKEAAHSFIEEENKPYIEHLRLFWKWAKENPRPPIDHEKYRSFVRWE